LFLSFTLRTRRTITTYPSLGSYEDHFELKLTVSLFRFLQSFDQLEKELLNGQKLQGVQTALELHSFLKSKGKVDKYPLFTFVVSSLFLRLFHSQFLSPPLRRGLKLTTSSMSSTELPTRESSPIPSPLTSRFASLLSLTYLPRPYRLVTLLRLSYSTYLTWSDDLG